MSQYDIGQVGSADYKSVLAKPVLVAGISSIWEATRGRLNSRVNVLGRDVNFGILNAVLMGASSVVAESISQYAFPEVNSQQRWALSSVSAILNAGLVGGASLLSHSTLAPEITSDISPLEMFAEGVVSDLLAQSAYEKFGGLFMIA